MNCKDGQQPFFLVKEKHSPIPVTMFGSSLSEITAFTENSGNMIFSDRNNRLALGKLQRDFEYDMVVKTYEEFTAGESFNVHFVWWYFY